MPDNVPMIEPSHDTATPAVLGRISIPDLQRRTATMWTAHEAAHYLGMSDNGLSYQVIRGRIPMLRLPRLNLFDRSDVETFRRQRYHNDIESPRIVQPGEIDPLTAPPAAMIAFPGQREFLAKRRAISAEKHRASAKRSDKRRQSLVESVRTEERLRNQAAWTRLFGAPFDEASIGQIRAALGHLAYLPERRLRVLATHQGLFGAKRSDAEMASDMGISRQRVEQLAKAARTGNPA